MSTERAEAPESYAWPLVAIVVVIAPQVLIPSRDRIGPPLIVPIVETIAFLILLAIAAIPGPVPARARPAILGVFATLIAANAVAAGRLVALVLDVGHHHSTLNAGRLLVAASVILLTNVITFGLLYWQLDAGGPAGRSSGDGGYADFYFPQSATPERVPPGWQPRFGDYLYLAYTNVVAFSPTDTMPFTQRAKALMSLQSAISLGVLVVVLARVINILPS